MRTGPSWARLRDGRDSAPSHLSHWRRQAREGTLAMPDASGGDFVELEVAAASEQGDGQGSSLAGRQPDWTELQQIHFDITRSAYESGFSKKTLCEFTGTDYDMLSKNAASKAIVGFQGDPSHAALSAELIELLDRDTITLRSLQMAMREPPIQLPADCHRRGKIDKCASTCYPINMHLIPLHGGIDLC